MLTIFLLVQTQQYVLCLVPEQTENCENILTPIRHVIPLMWKETRIWLCDVRAFFLAWFCTQRNIFQILLNQTGIRLYLPFSEWFGSKQRSVWFQINRKMVNTISLRVDLIKFVKYFSVQIFSCLVLTQPGSRNRASYLLRKTGCECYTENTRSPFPFKLNGIWSWW